MSFAATFQKAADILRERGHVKGNISGHGGTVCMGQALCLASGESWDSDNKAATALSAYLGDSPQDQAYEHYNNFSSICGYNNADERTPGEIIAKLEACAAAEAATEADEKEAVAA